MRTRRSCRRCWLSSRASISRSWPRALLPDAQIASALGVLASSGQVGFDLAAGAYFHRPLPVQAGCWIRCIPGWPRRASWWRRGCGAKRGAVRCNRRSSATGSRWAPSPRKTVAPAPGKYQGTRGPCKHTLAVRMFLDPLNALGAGALNLTERRAAARGRRRRRDAARYRAVRRALDGADEDERAALARPCRHRACSTRRGRRPGLLCWPHWVNRGGDAGAGGHGTQARIWRAPRRDDAGRDRGGSRTGRNGAPRSSSC